MVLVSVVPSSLHLTHPGANSHNSPPMVEFWQGNTPRHSFEAAPPFSASLAAAVLIESTNSICCCCAFGNSVPCKAQQLMKEGICFNFCSWRQRHSSELTQRRRWKTSNFPAHHLPDIGLGFLVWAGSSWSCLGIGGTSPSAAAKANGLCFTFCSLQTLREICCSMSFLLQLVEAEYPWFDTCYPTPLI